jgi:SAM-dependent methyltransferase
MRARQYLQRRIPRFLRRGIARSRFGALGRVQALSEWGEERGQPVDRWYIERFLSQNSGLVRGHALEVKSDRYASRFGASTVDVVDIDPTNRKATVVGDLCAPGTLPPEAFDVAVVTQTLQFLARPAEALHHLFVSLRPGGALLLTVPTVSRVMDRSDLWRWTPSGLQELLEQAAPAGADINAVGMGNGLASRAFLFGLAAEDLDAEVLARPDEHYPLIVGGRVIKAA